MSVHAARAKFWLFVALAPGWAAADNDDDRRGLRRPLDRIVVFGTSLSDPGNAFALTGENITPPGYGMTGLELITLIPAAPYAKGGNHFSNGPTWIEQLGASLGLASSVRPAMRGSSGRASNYAVGGARARDDGRSVHLSAQVSAFLRDVGPRAPSDALYVIEMGGNDIRDALTPGANAPLIIEGAITAIGSNVGRLYAAGARRFLIWNAPNLAVTPAVQALDAVSPGAATGAAILTGLFNSGIAELLGLLSGPTGLPGVEIVPFNAFQSLNNIIADPRSFGLVDVTTACIKPNVPPFQCQRPERHLFWDGIHPTRAGHAITAVLAGEALSIGLLVHD
jgi:phospholipase/lecithinase/hemolysin